MKYTILFLITILIGGCGVAGFQPPKQYFVWYLHNASELFPSSDPDNLIKYSKRRNEDMWSCGMDPVIGEGGGAKAALCLEKKGWYLKNGPACEDQVLYNDPLCVKWRAKRKR